MAFKKHLTIIILLLISSNVFSQFKNLDGDPAQFIKEFRTYMESTKVPTSMKAVADFENTWNGGTLTDAQRKQFVAIAQQMRKNKCAIKPQFEDLVSILNKQTLNQNQVDSLFYVCNALLTKTDNKGITKFLTATRVFVESSALFTSKFNSTYIIGGSFNFGIKKEDENPGGTPMGQTDTTQQQDWFESVETVNEVAPEEPMIETTSEDGQAGLASTYSPPSMPPIEGAYIRFTGIDIAIKTSNDSVIIAKTVGTYMYSNDLFVGKGGTYDWSNNGLASPGEIFVEFRDYNFNVKKAALTIENVAINNSAALDKKIDGVFEYRSMKVADVNKAVFPRFISFSNNVNLKNVGENITFVGGFAMSGKRIYSACVDNEKSELRVSSGGKLKFRAAARRFEINDTTVFSPNCNLAIYLEEDSLTHQSMQLFYNKMTKNFKLVKPGRRSTNTPFIDSYHKLEMVAELMKWNIDSLNMYFYTINARDQMPVVLESFDYFSGVKYLQLKGIESFHPIQVLVNYTKRAKTDEFYADDLAKDLKIQPNTLKSTIVEVSKYGYVDYNPVSSLVKVLPKAKHWSNSYNDKSDYNNIRIESITSKGPNVTLSLKNKELTVNGINSFSLCDSVNARVYPDSGTVKVTENRNLLVNGKIVAGAFTFVGKDFRFNYDEFLVDMRQIDSIRLNIKTEEKDKKNNFMNKKLNNQLVKSSGKLFLNKPNNKSGRKSFPEYPIFDAKGGAYVYFNNKEILNGVYDSSFYFKIPPFNVDSVNSFDNSAISFKGMFYSDGVLPPFEEVLRVQKDRSLGFDHKVPAEGYRAYDGKGKVFNEVIMNNNGLRVNGEVEYLNARLKSTDFILYHDSLTAKGKEAIMKETVINNVPFPASEIYDYETKWLATVDTMFIKNKEGKINLYDKTAQLTGNIVLTPAGLGGNGTLVTSGAKVESKAFTFYQKDFKAANANFEVNSDIANKPALLSKDVKFYFNFKDKYANFSPEVEGEANTEFPYAQYKTSLSKGKWDLEKKQVLMSSEKDDDINNLYFYSTNPNQDSLVFNATSSVYDMTKLTLNIKGIPYIYVADSKIMPDSGKVFIKENADMQELKNATITMDSLNEYHKLYGGSISILSRNQFQGSAKYDYINSQGVKHTMNFENFIPEDYQESRKRNYKITTARNIITETDSFYIAPRIMYKGNAKLSANKKYLDFEGFVKLDLKNDATSKWLAYKANENPDSITVVLKDPKSDAGMPLYTGLHLSKDTAAVYTTFVAEKRMLDDYDFMTTQGLISFDATNNEFKVLDPRRVQADSYEGNIISYDDSKSVMHYDGGIKLLHTVKDIEIKSSAEGMADIAKNAFEFTGNLVIVDFKLPAPYTTLIGETVDKYDNNESVAIEDQEKLLKGIANTVGNLQALKYQETRKEGYISLGEFSGVFNKTFVLTDVHFKWSDKEKAWYSTKEVGISNIGKQDINSKFKCYIEIKYGITGEIVNMYLSVNPETWFYFGYTDKKLITLSSITDYNTMVTGKGKVAKEGKYSVLLADLIEKVNFVKRYSEDYLHIKYVEDAADAHLDSQPVEETIEQTEESTEEENKDKKHKKNKKEAETEETQTEEEPADEQSEEVTEEPVQEEKKDKKKKKEKEAPVEETTEEPTQEEEKQLTPEETPAAEPPAEESGKKKKEKKKKEEETKQEEPAAEPSNQLTPEETPAAEPPAEDKKKKKKDKKEEEQPAAETPAEEVETPATEEAAPGEEAKPKKEKKKKEKKKKEEEQTEEEESEEEESDESEE